MNFVTNRMAQNMTTTPQIRGVSRRWFFWGLGVSVALAVGLRLALFLAGCQFMDAFDDECIMALQAMQIADGDFSLFMLGQPYVFPLEAYLMAPFVDILPRTAFGARIMAFGFGLTTLGLAWLALVCCGRLRETWPGALLLLFGSSFLLILQGGCALPGYPTLMLLCCLTSWLVLRFTEKKSESLGWLFLAGGSAGLACSGFFLALPVLVAGGVMLGSCRPWRVAVRAVGVYSIGAAVGLIPYFLARLLHGDAPGVVTGIVSWQEALGRLIGYLPLTLSNAMGIGCPVVPGSATRILHHGDSARVAGVTVLVLFLIGTVAGCLRWRQRHWKAFPPLLFFVAIAWGCLVLFLFGARTNSHAYRYLTPMVMSFPFVVACLYQASTGWWRKGLAGLAILLAVFNAYTTVLLIRHWARPDFSRELGSHDLRPVLDYLRQRQITHAYASYADAYRITFKTDRHILCAQPYNERFPGWPLPFIREVDATTPVAYILADGGRFPPEQLELDLASASMGATRTRLGVYQVFTDFIPKTRVIQGPFLPLSAMKAEASHAPQLAHHMVDDSSQFWRCAGFLQMTGMWVSVTWDKPVEIRGVVVSHGSSGGDFPEAVAVFVREAGTNWIQVATNMPALPLPFSIVSGHPSYSDSSAQFVFPEPRLACGVKVEISRPRLSRAWTISTLKVWRGE